MSIVCILSICGFSTRAALAENEGQEDLDKAIETQLEIKTLADLETVIRLSESALEKGLDEGNTKFAKKLLSSTLLNHAKMLSSAIFDRRAPGQRWIALRRVAIEDLDKALKHDKEFGEAHFLRARLLMLPRGDRKEAMKSANSAVELFKKESPKELSEALVLRATLQSDVKKQIEDINQAIEADSSNAKAWQTRAVYYLSQGENEKAVADFNKLLKDDETNIAVHLAVVEALLNMNKYDSALKHADKVIELQPKAPISYSLRAQIFMRQEKYDEALSDLGEALKLQPRYIEAMLMRARIYIAKNQLDLAKQDVDRALKIRPDAMQALLLRSALLASEGRLSLAIADAKTLLKASPKNPILVLHLARLYTDDRRPRRTIEVLTELLKEDKQNWMAFRARGDAYLSVGKHKEAIADYESALKISPKNDGLLNNLAWVLATSSKEGVRDGKRSIELGQLACEVTEYKMPHIISTLAAGYAEAGDFEQARKWIQKALDLGQGEELLEHLNKELESYKQNKPFRELQEIKENPLPEEPSSKKVET